MKLNSKNAAIELAELVIDNLEKNTIYICEFAESIENAIRNLYCYINISSKADEDYIIKKSEEIVRKHLIKIISHELMEQIIERDEMLEIKQNVYLETQKNMIEIQS